MGALSFHADGQTDGHDETNSHLFPCLLMYIFLQCVYYFSCRMLARSQYPEGPTTGHLGTGFSWSIGEC
jgi:hypothetical protein